MAQSSFLQEQLVPEAMKTDHLLQNDIVGAVFANVVSGNITYAPERLQNEAEVRHQGNMSSY